jgi:hypothetical protein
LAQAVGEIGDAGQIDDRDVPGRPVEEAVTLAGQHLEGAARGLAEQSRQPHSESLAPRRPIQSP